MRRCFSRISLFGHCVFFIGLTIIFVCPYVMLGFGMSSVIKQSHWSKEECRLLNTTGIACFDNEFGNWEFKYDYIATAPQKCENQTMSRWSWDFDCPEGEKALFSEATEQFSIHKCYIKDCSDGKFAFSKKHNVTLGIVGISFACLFMSCPCVMYVRYKKIRSSEV